MIGLIDRLRTPLSPRAMAVLLLGGFFLVVVVSLFLIVQAVDVAVSERDASFEQLEALNHRPLPGRTRNGRQAEVGPLVEPAFTGASESIAVNALQEMVLHRIEDSGSTIMSFQGQRSEDEPGAPRRLRIEATFKTTLGALQRILYGLETATPFVFIDTLSVQVIKPDESDSGSRDTETLRVVLGANGFWRKGP